MITKLPSAQFLGTLLPTRSFPAAQSFPCAWHRLCTSANGCTRGWARGLQPRESMNELSMGHCPVRRWKDPACLEVFSLLQSQPAKHPLPWAVECSPPQGSPEKQRTGGYLHGCCRLLMVSGPRLPSLWLAKGPSWRRGGVFLKLQSAPVVWHRKGFIWGLESG